MTMNIFRNKRTVQIWKHDAPIGAYIEIHQGNRDQNTFTDLANQFDRALAGASHPYSYHYVPHCYQVIRAIISLYIHIH